MARAVRKIDLPLDQLRYLVQQAAAVADGTAPLTPAAERLVEAWLQVQLCVGDLRLLTSRPNGSRFHIFVDSELFPGNERCECRAQLLSIAFPALN